jgi:predicted regulator of Ras-like GTPase activity (Roadblock/LC7/MglB family)
MTPSPVEPKITNIISHLRVLCDRELADVLHRFPDVTLAVVSTADARAVSCKYARPGEPNRLAAMISSLFSLCESFSSEIQGGECQSVSLSMGDCACVVVRIASVDLPLVLAVVIEEEVMLAIGRRIASTLSEKIAKAIDNSTDLKGLKDF